MVFLSSGGTLDTLSQLHVTPTGLDRDLLYYLLQTLRQVETRPHLTNLAFAPIGGAALQGHVQAQQARVRVQDFQSFLAAEASKRGELAPAVPLLLRSGWQAFIAASAASKQGASDSSARVPGRPAAGSKDMLADVADIFAQSKTPPPGQSVAAGASSSAAASSSDHAAAAPSDMAEIYGDLVDTLDAATSL